MSALLLATFLNAVGIPRLWIAAALGLICSPVAAFAWAMLGGLIGNALLFTAARHLLADSIRRRLARSRAAFLLRTTPGFLETVLIRQLPLPGLLTTLALAVSKTRLSAMLLGSFVGWLPSTWIVTMLSGSAAQAQVPGPWIAASMAGACLLLILLKRAARRHRIGMLGTLPAHRTRRNA